MADARMGWAPAAGMLGWLAVTLAFYGVGRMLQRVCRGSPLANPVLIAIGLVAAALAATGTPYAVYFADARAIHWLLGPATVALAVPLAANVRHVGRSAHGVGLALLAGAAVSMVSGVAVVWALGGGRALGLSMAPKAVTTPIAMALSGGAGGLPALTVALAIGGGIVAAAAGGPVLGWLGVDDWRARGLAAGVAGSGVAAAQVAAESGVGGAFAALGVGLNGLITAFLLPLAVALAAWLWPGG